MEAKAGIMKIDQITVVIRTIGERTTDASIQIAQKIFGEENVYVVKNVTPFSEAIRESFALGIRAGKKWTLILDADILLDSDAVIRYITDANQYSRWHHRIFSFTSMVDDKFLMKRRVGGGHLYRTKYLKKTCRFISDGENDLRPETYIKRRMNALGYATFFCNISIGLHDYFQSYKDIFRKGILHSKKHKDVEQLYVKWKAKSDQDKDFFWICKGMDEGKQIEEDVKVDVQYFDKYMQQYTQQFEQQEPFTDWDQETKFIKQTEEEPEEIHFERIWIKETWNHRMKKKLYEWWKANELY